MRRIISLILSIFLFLGFVNINNNNVQNQPNKLLNDLNIQDESINYDLSETYDISILVKFNINQFNRTFQQINNDEQLRLYRDTVKDYYVSQNENAIEKMNLDDYVYDISYYAPFMEIVFDDIDEYENKKDNLISILNGNKCVECFSVNCIGFDDATVNSDTCSSNYPFSTAKSDIGIPSSLTYTGNGIRVGTIESGTPDSTTNLKSDKFTRLSTSTTSHSTWVTSIIGGYTGIAEDAHLYCIELNYPSSLTSCINVLIYTCQVDIVNMSFSCNKSGCYDYYCTYIDDVVQNARCTFVKSAGNFYNDYFKIGSPGCGMNVITVGSISANQNVSYFSSWYTSDNFLYKPDMVAPGEKISNIPNLIGTNSGTSFATPMVTGVVALLMEEFPILKLYPDMVKAALQNGCVELPSQTSYFDEQCGFGLLNYQKARAYLNNYQYNNFYIPIDGVDGDIVTSCNVTIPSCKVLEINANWLINSVEVVPGNSPYLPVFTKCYLKLYDIQNSCYVESVSNNSNIGFLEYINPSSSSKQYRIDVVINGAKASGGIENGSLVYNIEKTHVHNYTYTWKNYTLHKTNCVCGESHNDPHVVAPGSFNNGQQYTTCLLCGGLASSGVVIYEGINPISPTTTNSNTTISLNDLEPNLNKNIMFYRYNSESLKNTINKIYYSKKNLYLCK